MPEIRPPADPTGAERACGRCKHFLASEKKNCVLWQQPGGGVSWLPVAEAIKHGVSLQNGMTAVVSQCTQGPVWPQVMEQHWCGRFEAHDN